MKKIMPALLMAAALLFAAAAGRAGQTPAPEGAKLYFISPPDGVVVSSPVFVQFGLSGMGVAPAGVEKENTGHHHIFVDAPLPSGEALNEAIVKDAQHLHFGGGQTEAMIALPPGKHTLQLLLGDHNHIPHKTPLASKPVTITVK